MIEILAIAAVVLVLSGIFAGVEAALLSLNDAEVYALVEKKRPGSKILAKVHGDMHRAVITTVIFNNAVNIGGSIIVGQITVGLYGDAMLAIITTVMTFAIIVFSEILPKSLGIHYAETIGITGAPLILVLTTILTPLIALLDSFTSMFHKGERKVGTEEQIRSLVTLGRRKGLIESDEGQLIHRAFILNDRKARDIMTPLKDIVGVSATDRLGEAVKKVFVNHYSRYPVFGASINDVVGFVLTQDILAAMEEEKDAEPVSSIMREALVITGEKKGDQLIALFRDKHIHMAVVQDDGHTVGIVTLEDVFEELVGEIEDEKDIEN